MQRYKKQPHQQKPAYNPTEALQLPTDAKVGVYSRQSTINQVRYKTTSGEMQTDDLIALAKRLGWQEDHIILYVENVGKNGAIKNASGKLRIDQREGLRALVQRIEAGEIKAVIVFLEDRLFRDETQIQVNTFILICQEHNVLVITPSMTYDFRNPYHVKQFRMKCEAAADYLREYVMERLHGGRDRTTSRGLYDGRAIPAGFIVDRREKIAGEPNPTYKRFIVYEPHARVVRRIYRRYMELGGKVVKLYEELREEPVLFAEFDASVDPRNASRLNLQKVPGGYHISFTGLIYLLANIAYIGWWLFKGEIIKDNHAPIVDEGQFWYAFNRISDYTPHGEAQARPRYRPRYQQADKPEAPALLKEIIQTTDQKKTVYVGFDFGEWYYRIAWKNAHNEDTAEVFSIVIDHVDQAFQAKLVEHMRATPDFATHFRKFVEAMKQEAQEACTSIATQISIIEEQKRGYLLSLGNPSLPQATREATELLYADLTKQQGELQEKLDKANPEKRIARLLKYQDVMHRLGPEWDGLPLEDKKLLIEAATREVTLDRLSAHFMLLTIHWRLSSWGTDTALLWRPKGCAPLWQDEELALLVANYPTMPQEQLLQLLPKRSWRSIIVKAHQKGVTRSVKGRNTIQDDTLSFEDVRVMEEYDLCPCEVLPENQIIWCAPFLPAS